MNKQQEIIKEKTVVKKKALFFLHYKQVFNLVGEIKRGYLYFKRSPKLQMKNPLSPTAPIYFILYLFYSNVAREYTLWQCSYLIPFNTISQISFVEFLFALNLALIFIFLNLFEL